MSDKNLSLNQKHAEVVAKHLFEKFSSLQYSVTTPIKGNYNYNFKIKNANSTVHIIIYYNQNGNKIVLQGNQNTLLYKEISKKLNEIISMNVNILDKLNIADEPASYIGVDESGKGDFFGPLIIAGFLVTPEIKNELLTLNVQDSKRVSDEKIIVIANSIKEKFKDYYSIVQIYPKKYNELYKKIGNLNSILAWGHSRCIENILARHKVSLAICDQFGNENYIKSALMKEGKQIQLIQTTKAERFVGVAAASILARQSFIDWIKRTEEKIGLKIPKGANEKVKEVARLIIEREGKEALDNYVKVHFKTMQEL